MEKRIQTKYAIIGLGILGTSVLRALLAAGEKDIVVIEKETSFGGATAHSFGMLRVFHDSATLRNLALQSFQSVQNASELRLAERRPFLSLRKISKELFTKVHELQKQHYPLEVLNSQEIESRYGIEVSSQEVGILESEALTFDPHELLALYRDEAKDRALILQDQVCCVLENPSSVDILTQGGTSIRATSVVIAAGAGSIPLLSGRGLFYTEKAMSYSVSEQSLPGLPQLLSAQSHEFLSQRKGKSYYRFGKEKALLRSVAFKSTQEHIAFDVQSGSAGESFGRLPGSKRIYSVGAWSGNAFKLSWQISKVIAECLLEAQSKEKRTQLIGPHSPKGSVYENSKLI